MTASAPEARPLHAGEKNRHPDGKTGTLMKKSAGLSEKSVPPPQPAASTGRTHRPAGAFRGTEGPACAE